MNYTLTPSLKHITLIKIVSTLWNQDDIRTLMENYNLTFVPSEGIRVWQAIENEVIEKVPQLFRSNLLKEEILGFIKPIGIQILKWMEYHRKNKYLSICLPNEFCWTPQGTIDKKKTAEVLIKDRNIDIIRRYKLACIYCLKDDIPVLWDEIPENSQRAIYREDPRMVRQQLVVFWTYDIHRAVNMMNNMIQRRRGGNCSPYQFAFEFAALGGYKAATVYFLQKLTPGEREETLVRFAGYTANRRSPLFHNLSDFPEDYADVLCFLLSQMDKEDQIEVFKSYPLKVLKCLLDWPWQSFFMETANRMWDFLSEEKYYVLLTMIVEKVKDGYKDYNYQELFGEFWQQSPTANRRYVIGECILNGFLLLSLFKIEDVKNVRLILKNTTVKEKEEIIFDKGMNICVSLLYNNKWYSPKFFVQECISSKEAMIKFKEDFKERLISHYSFEQRERKKDVWSKFFLLLDDLIHKDDIKRSVEEGDSSPHPSKKLHNAELKEV